MFFRPCTKSVVLIFSVIDPSGAFSKNSIAKDRYPIGNKTVDDMFQFIKSIS